MSKVKTELCVEEEAATMVEMTTSSSVSGVATACDLSQGDDVVSSTSDMFPCDFEGTVCLACHCVCAYARFMSSGYIKYK